jgi:hypothetical protein
MPAIKTLLIAAVVASPLAATAAELPMPETQRAAAHHHRVHISYAPRVHVGYYWGDWASRQGGSPRFWYGSVFAFGGAPGWSGVSTAIASSRRLAVIDCAGPRPGVCVAEPVVTPVPYGAPHWR